MESELAATETASTAADAAYEALAVALCGGEHTTRFWIDVLNRHINAGAWEIIPDADRAHVVSVPDAAEGPDARAVVGDADSAAFATAPNASVTNTALLQRIACKALGEFLAQSQVEKRSPPSSTDSGSQPKATPRYEPNVFLGAETACAGCEPWADAVIAALGDTVTRLERAVIRWRDTSVPGIASVVKAMTTMGEDGDATPETRKVGGAYVELDDFGDGALAVLRECNLRGVFPTGLILPATLAFSKQAAKVKHECERLGIEILAKDVLMGGLISEKYVGAASTSIHFPNLATKRGTPEFEPLRSVMQTQGGWEKHQKLLTTLKAVVHDGVGSIETAAVNCFLEENMRVVVMTALDAPPAFQVLPEFLPKQCKPKKVEELVTSETEAEEPVTSETETGEEESDKKEGTVEPVVQVEVALVEKKPSVFTETRVAWNEAYGVTDGGDAAA